MMLSMSLHARVGSQTFRTLPPALQLVELQVCIIQFLRCIKIDFAEIILSVKVQFFDDPEDTLKP